LKLFVEIPKEGDHFENLDAFEGTAEVKLSLSTPWRHMGEKGRDVDIQLNSFLNSALDGGV